MGRNLPDILRWWRIDLAGLGGCVLVTLAVYFALVRPSQSRQIDYQVRQESLAERSSAMNEARASLTEMRKGMKLAETELSELPLTLKPATGVNQRLASLADLASQSGLEVHQMQPAAIRSGDLYDETPIILTGSGDYRRVTSFLRTLHDGFADIGVVKFDLTADNPGGSAHFDLGLVWYTSPSLSLVEE